MNQNQRYNIYLLTSLTAINPFRKRPGKKNQLLSALLLAIIFSGIPFLLNAQTKEVVLTGRITDSKNNDPLAGVVVHIKGTTHQVLTDEKGDFKFITGQQVPLVYELSYVGFKSKEVNITSFDFAQITLDNNNKGLSEVVVVGYGTQRKSDITGSIASVPKGLLSIPATSFDNLLQGFIRRRVWP